MLKCRALRNRAVTFTNVYPPQCNRPVRAAAVHEETKWGPWFAEIPAMEMRRWLRQNFDHVDRFRDGDLRGLTVYTVEEDGDLLEDGCDEVLAYRNASGRYAMDSWDQHWWSFPGYVNIRAWAPLTGRMRRVRRHNGVAVRPSVRVGRR